MLEAFSPINFKGERTMHKSEFKVTIKENGHILYKGQLISLLAQWNSYWDLCPDTLINRLKEKK